MAYQSFEDLGVWQRGCRLSVEIFRAFQDCEKYTLKDQIERKGLSIPSNIAEGAERGSAKDFAHFLNFSKGSCGELRTQSLDSCQESPQTKRAQAQNLELNP